MPEDDDRYNRRRFFREGFRELLKPLARAADPIADAIKQFEQIAGERAAPVPTQWLRPPGALPEKSFVDTCSRCGECARVCPAQCIKIDTTGTRGMGAPHIEVNEMPCVVCDGLQCMHVCPSGALSPIPLSHVKMGLAVWNSSTCVRKTGENCTICIDDCPIGSAAIELRGDRVHVIEAGCIGCGVCQNHCPTNPKSIVVVPHQH